MPAAKTSLWRRWSSRVIAVDASALLAVVLGEERAVECKSVLETENEILISAGTLSEAFIVSASRNIDEELANVVEGLGCRRISRHIGFGQADRARESAVGRGFHPASLNFGDCFAYELAISCGCPLLYIGNDFVRTHVASAL